MRKISRLAALAFRGQKQFTMGNTSVRHERHPDGHLISEMRLHGNLIAKRNWSVDGLSAVHVTLAGWGTPTTRERVNGLLDMLGTRAGYYQQNHCQMFTDSNGNREVDSSDWIKVETTS